jgi:hypothetical protein
VIVATLHGKIRLCRQKLLVIHLRVVWPEPSFPAQTSVFIAFTGDSPSGLEAKPKDASNQTEAKVGYEEPLSNTYSVSEFLCRCERGRTKTPSFLQLCDGL